MSHSIHATSLAAALGCGLVGGLCFAFSTAVMPAFDDLAPSAAIAAMQSINRSIVNPVFLLALLGTALACVALVVWSIRGWGQPGARLVLAGAALYLVGMIGVTFAANIPLNDTLDAVRASGATAAQDWSDFAGPWTVLNHIRTLAAFAAAGLLTAGLSSAD
jgi:uncharacterized membrane protein